VDLNNEDSNKCVGFSWLRMGSNSMLLCMWYWSSGFHKMQGFRVMCVLLASQEICKHVALSLALQCGCFNPVNGMIRHCFKS
jgi:hypothetical protein